MKNFFLLAFRFSLTAAFAATVFLISPLTSAAPVAVEGKDYETIAPPLPVSGDKIEVVEFFSYGCPYCYQIEPHLEAWLSRKPADVSFTRFAVSRGERWQSYARAFYTLQALNEEARLTPVFFKAIHDGKQNFDNEQVFLDWAEQQKLDRAKVETAYASEAVTQKTSAAMQALKDYKVRKIPTLYIDGRFHLIPEGVTEYERIPAMLDELIDQARVARKTK